MQANHGMYYMTALGVSIVILIPECCREGGGVTWVQNKAQACP